MSSKWQKAKRPPKQTQLSPKAREDLEITSSDKDSTVSRYAEGKCKPLSSVHRNAGPKPLELRQPASRKLTQTFIKVARDASINTETELPKENRPLSPSYPSSFMSSNIPKKRAMPQPQSSQKLHDIAASRAPESPNRLISSQISSKSRLGEEERQAIHTPTRANHVPLFEETSETLLQYGSGNNTTTSKADSIRYPKKPTNARPESSPGQRDRSHDKSEKSKANSSKKLTRSYLSSVTHQKEETKPDTPGPELREQHLLNPKSFDKQQLQRMNTTRSDFEDADIIPITKQVHVSKNCFDDEQSRMSTDTRIVHEPESNSQDDLATINTGFSTSEDNFGMTDNTVQPVISDVSPCRLPQVLNDTTTPATKVEALKHTSPASRSDSEDDDKNISTTIARSNSYTVQSTTVYDRSQSSPSSDIPTSSTDLLSPDIGYETHTMYPNPMGHDLPEKLGLLHDTQIGTIPLSLDTIDFDLVPAFPNPTGKRLLEKLALAAQENKPSNMAQSHSVRDDETVDSATTDEIPSSPIY